MNDAQTGEDDRMPPQTEATDAPVTTTTGAPVTEEAAPSTRLRWWTELPLILLVYGAYSAGRLLARGDTASAVDHGLAILRVEKALWLNAEHPLNRLFTREPWIGIPADFWYASLHYLVTPALLVWLFRSRAVRYRAARTWLMTSTFIGLIGFTLFPTCPPRLLDPSHGFVDTMAHYSAWGWWGGEASAPRGLGGMTNQYAAMPSLHVGWSLWCGVILWRFGGGSRLVRAAAVAYPLITTIVVMGTANHYFLDAVAGAAVMGVGLLLAPVVTRIVDQSRVALGLGVVAADRFDGKGGDRGDGGVGATVDGGGRRRVKERAPEPVTPEPATGGSVPAEPTATTPVRAEPAATTPAPAEPSAVAPVPTEPAAVAPTPTEPIATTPALTESAATTPVAAGPVAVGAGVSRGSVSPIVSGGCQTSPGERIPRQRITGTEPGAAPSAAGDGAAAAAR
jgi:hypothetical protein|uniref:phosphatase PAP2 family protein n=1 Tax=Streptomyces ipomoeae TaxID=103232 RepID=UPI00215C4BF8|nr:phosphatase PAP2 family protein [Streptomyces ipomoeae]